MDAEARNNITNLAKNVSNTTINKSVANRTNEIQNKSIPDDKINSDIKDATVDYSSKGTSVKEGDNIESTTDPALAVAESKSGGYSFVGDKIFKVTQEAGKGTCVIPSDAKEVIQDNDFINSMKTTLGIKSGGSRSANKKNKITCKKKGGRKYKKSMKHKKGAKKC